MNNQQRQEEIRFLKACNFSPELLRVPTSEKIVPRKIYQNNQYLQEVKFSKGVEEIGEEAFKGCTGLDVLILPKSIKHLGSECFSGCTSLRNVSMSLETIQNIGTNPFGESAFNKECGWGVKTILGGIVSSQDTVQKWVQLYGFERKVDQYIKVGVDEEGNDLTIRYVLNFPVGNAIYPESDFGDTSPIGYEKTEPIIYPVCAQEASQNVPLILGTLDGSTYLIENWDYCRENPSFLMAEAQEQHQELNDPQHQWSFVVNDVPNKTFDLQAYLMKVYYEEQNLSDPIFIVWDNVKE